MPSPIVNPSKSAIILCGGHSRRMGRPKAWLPFGEEFLLQRIVRIVGEVVQEVIVVAAYGQDLPPLPPNVRRINDQIPESGPLAGFAAGLDDCQTDAAFLTACDVPFLMTEFIVTLFTRLNESSCDAVVPFLDGFHPLSAVYRISIRPVVERRLVERQLRVKDLFHEIPFETWHPGSDAEPIRQMLRNINTPEDYAAALADYNSRHGTD